MIQTTYPKFHNNQGVAEILIGTKKFQCIGAIPPHDHPHIYLNMGDKSHITCPYCSSIYRYENTLENCTSKPEKCYLEE